MWRIAYLEATTAPVVVYYREELGTTAWVRPVGEFVERFGELE